VISIFKPVVAPTSDAQKKKIITSQEVVINGSVHKIGWHTIDRTAQKLPSLDGKIMEIFGQVKYGGAWIHCAGMKTPWGSHLNPEEHEPDAKK